MIAEAYSFMVQTPLFGIVAAVVVLIALVVLAFILFSRKR